MPSFVDTLTLSGPDVSPPRVSVTTASPQSSPTVVDGVSQPTVGSRPSLPDLPEVAVAVACVSAVVIACRAKGGPQEETVRHDSCSSAPS